MIDIDKIDLALTLLKKYNPALYEDVLIRMIEDLAGTIVLLNNREN